MAIRSMLQACAVHNYLAGRARELVLPAPAVDVSPAIFSGLTSLSLAEATLLAVLKDDPYPAVVAQQRSSTDNEWMVKAPTIPRYAHTSLRDCA